MPRRYVDYPVAFEYWHWWSSIGSFIAGASFVLFIGLMVYTVLRGQRIANPNYWDDPYGTLEWTLPNPPPAHTFETLPTAEVWESAPRGSRDPGSAVETRGGRTT
jgi:cytochrome c oxidase subunit 1